jgi:hypothetical protein
MGRHACTLLGKLSLTAVLTALGCAEAEEISRLRGAEDGGSMTGESGSGSTGSTGGTGSGATGGQGGSVVGGGSSARGGSAGKGGSGGTGGSTGTGGTTSRPPPPPGSFLDDFEDGNFTVPSWIDADPTLGGMWSVRPDGATQVFTQSAPVSDWVISVSGDYRWTDQVVEAKVKFTSAPGMIGIFARFMDTRNYYFLYLDGANIILRKRVNNSSTNLLKIKTVTAMGTWYTLKLSIVGTMLVGYLDGTMLVSATDVDLAAGGIAVGTSDSATGAFDDVSVTQPSVTQP